MTDLTLFTRYYCILFIKCIFTILAGTGNVWKIKLSMERDDELGIHSKLIMQKKREELN